jgi:hypothetical protein
MSGTKDEQPGFAVCAAATASLMGSHRGMPFPSGVGHRSLRRHVEP